MLSDAVAIQLITTVGTIITVAVTGYLNRRTTRKEGKELHKRFDTLAQRDSGAHSMTELHAGAAVDTVERVRPLTGEQRVVDEHPWNGGR